jgi:hypothetical protein
MTMGPCQHELAIAAAVRDDAWTEDLRDHVATCEACAETAMVTAALTDFSAAHPGRTAAFPIGSLEARTDRTQA